MRQWCESDYPEGMACSDQLPLETQTSTLILQVLCHHLAPGVGFAAQDERVCRGAVARVAHAIKQRPVSNARGREEDLGAAD